MRALRVTPLPGVDEQRGVLEEVEVLVVVPVGVAHHRHVDVSGREPAPLQGRQHGGAPSHMAHVDEGPLLPRDEDDAAEAGDAGVRAEAVAVQENVNGGHGRLLRPASVASVGCSSYHGARGRRQAAQSLTLGPVQKGVAIRFGIRIRA